MARRLAGFGVRIIAVDDAVDDAAFAAAGAERADLDRLLAESDVVSVHAPLTAETRGLLGDDALRRLRPGAILVNTARGAIVDGAALNRALEDGHLAGAALDVLEREPPTAADPLLHRNDVTVTPHAGFLSDRLAGRRAADRGRGGAARPHRRSPAPCRQLDRLGDDAVKALVWQGGQKLVVEDVAGATPSDDEVELHVRLAAICGSDLHGYRGHPGPRVPPLVLGHEAVGTVDGLPGRFVPFPLWSCGSCPACRRDDVHLCARRGLLGLDRPGVFAETVAVPRASLVPVPDDMDDRVAVLVEPMAVCVAALREDGVRADDRVLVIGSGPIGLLTVHAAVVAGADVEVIELLPRRRAVAAALGGVQVHAGGGTIADASFDVAYDAVGIEAAWRTAIRAVRRGGRATIVGLGSDEGTVPVGVLVRQAITLRGHYAYTRADFAAAMRLLHERPPPLDWMETMSLDQGAHAFARLVAAPDTTIKVALAVI